MPTQTPTVPADATPSYPACVEHGVWIPVPVAAPGDSQHLKLKDIDDHESHAIRERGVLTFHAVGCSGDFKEHLPGSLVAETMAAQIGNPHGNGGKRAAVEASFLFHLGDLVYKDEAPSDLEGKDQTAIYNSQFYAHGMGGPGRRRRGDRNGPV